MFEIGMKAVYGDKLLGYSHISNKGVNNKNGPGHKKITC